MAKNEGYNTEELDQVAQVPHLAPGQLPRDLTIVHMRELDTDWADQMEFNKEPVTIRILPPNERNPPNYIECGVNGVGCEVWNERAKRWDQWFRVPVNEIITVKRMYLENLLRSRITRIRTADFRPGQGDPDPTIYRDTTSVFSVDIIKDKNPQGREWVDSIRRQMI